MALAKNVLYLRDRSAIIGLIPSDLIRPVSTVPSTPAVLRDPARRRNALVAGNIGFNPQRRLPVDVSITAHTKNTGNGPGRNRVIGKGY